jgi:DNA-directed RNA polymerase sigma subunit (sigma70/sigma32)
MDAPAELYPALSHFGSKAHEHSRLSHGEARELYRRCLDCQDEQARRYLVRAFMRYVIIIALKYCQYGIPLASLIAEGKLGIVHALTNFDAGCGQRFSTYIAYWIRLYILSHVIHSLGSLGADSRKSQSTLFKLRRERVRIAGLLSIRSRFEAAAGSHTSCRPSTA